MVGERGAPAVQDREDTDAGAEVFGIGRDGEHGLGRSLEQDAVDCGLVLVGDIGDLSRQREHDVEVGHRQELSLALGQPLARGRSLALRTVPIATGVVADLRVTAALVLAACDMAAELCRAAALDRRHHLELLEADMAGIGLTPCRSMAAENIRDLQLRTGHCRGRYAGGWSFSPISGFLPGFFLGFLRGCDSRSSGLLMFAIMPVATRV